MRLKKNLEEKLLGKIFAEYSLVSKGESNNGAFYTLKKGDDKIHIKIVDKEQEDEEGLDETAITAAASGSRYIAKLLRTGDLNERYGYLVFEHIAGKDLSKTRTLNAVQLQKLAEQITSAVCDLWAKGIVHRDIKPGNIMLGDDGNFYLVDLGIGYYMETPNRDNTKTKGSRYYSSPEQFFATIEPRTELTFASDLYSLGMILFEKASGNHPKSSWTSKQNSYGELITQTEPVRIETVVTGLPTNLTIFINKLLAVYKSDRFLAPEEALALLKDEPAHQKSTGSVYLHDYGNNHAFIDPYLATAGTNKPDAIVLSILQGEERVKTLQKMGYEIIIDPMTYRLPHPLATNDAIKKKLGYKTKSTFTADKVNESRASLVNAVIGHQKKAKFFLLPYFAIESLEDPFLTTNKLIWSEGKPIAKNVDEFKPVYGGMVVPASITKDTRSTDKLINLTHGRYGLDGYYLIFESPDDKVTAIDSIAFLSNVRKIVDAFSSMGEVLIGHADVSYLLTIAHASLAFGWSNSKRRFVFDSELNGKPSGFMLKDYDPKLLYYIPQLLTLVKGEDEMETLHTFAPKGSIDCDCDPCSELEPFDGVTPKKLDLAAQHYFKTVVDQQYSLRADPYTTQVALLSAARDLTLEIKKLSRNTAGSKLIPNHEAILSVVND